MATKRKQAMLELSKSRLASKVAAYRTIRGVSMQQLADQSGVSIATISSVCRGLMTARTSVIWKLAHALNCRVSDLV